MGEYVLFSPFRPSKITKERGNAMRYLIISYDDYFNIPYIRFYEEALQKQGHSYDIVLWPRSGQSAGLPNSFEFFGKDRPSKLGKLLPFFQWRKFALNILKQNQYDRLIILTTMLVNWLFSE